MCLRSEVVTPNLIVNTAKLIYYVRTFAKNAQAEYRLFAISLKGVIMLCRLCAV
jgi:hypothetical protein